MTSARLHVALVHPEIPQNTGNIGRLCVGIGACLHLVHPLSFDTSERAVRRAGLDYWKLLDLVEHRDEPTFWSWAADKRVHLFSSHGSSPYTRIHYAEGDVLVFGRESVGLAPELLAQHGSYSIPMTGPVRSLNLSNAAAVVCYEAMRQIFPDLF